MGGVVDKQQKDSAFHKRLDNPLTEGLFSIIIFSLLKKPFARNIPPPPSIH
jgi:hypothetical protein